nr:65-kDa microtubule-associated protein 3-like [Tanacetum cinerariifolium]
MSCGGASNKRLSMGEVMLAPRTDLDSTRAAPNTPSIYNESARMKGQGQDDLRFEGLTKDISKVEDLIAIISCN